MTAKASPGPPNRLANSGSPYLLAHAHNPVDWYPWSEEAFRRAEVENKPVFLSIGYSTCHWCHVMEAESFNDREVADLMNETFVCVKVDREERPDLDHIYMAVCQQLTGSGGWPLTIIMTPDRKPFFAGTYFPRGGGAGRTGMLELIPQVRDLWQGSRHKAEAVAGEIVSSLRDALAPQPASSHGTDLGSRAYAILSGRFDQRHGGFGSAPKFPVPANLLFLLRHWHRTGEERALEMVTRTLKAMRMGGIYDHLGYGIHRYSTDARWFAPHFEKMLYDQALV
ncbi:MAG: thioredoxin domain-containing protein, partial [bacterium]